MIYESAAEGEAQRDVPPCHLTNIGFTIGETYQSRVLSEFLSEMEGRSFTQGIPSSCRREDVILNIQTNFMMCEARANLIIAFSLHWIVPDELNGLQMPSSSQLDRLAI